MSSILKALKKLEEEKSAKQGQRVDITRDIFGAAQQPATGPRWPVIASGIAGAVVLGVAGYLFFIRSGGSPTSPLPAPAVTRLNAALPPPLPAVAPDTPPQPFQEASQDAPKPATSPAAPPPVPRKESARATTPLSAPAQPTPAKPRAPAPIPVISVNRPVLSNLPSQAKPAIPGAPVTPATSPAAAPPRIAVSGIAYNKEAADRLAVINGVPLGEGKTFSGVTVEEIMPDKVRFSFGQKSFEVPVGRSNQ